MSDKTSYRAERIERLLQELRYEVEVGMLQGEIDENLSFLFIVPFSKEMRDGVVRCEFRTRPTHRAMVDVRPSLSVVKGVES